jgi:hemin uptake protein HemP
MPPTAHSLSPVVSRRDATPGQATAASEIIPAENLFKGAQVILIRHRGDDYHLRITRNDKLILTK